VLNGGLFALLGLHDVAEALADDEAAAMLTSGISALVALLPRWDVGWWSRYDLYPFRVPHLASLAYHELHEHQLRALYRVTGRPELVAFADRFGGQRASWLRRNGALVAKVGFRLAVRRS
jgi:heparosan-N-sulfate-glucuronate 5-epimerase